mgnify:CR=1 FL=1
MKVAILIEQIFGGVNLVTRSLTEKGYEQSADLPVGRHGSVVHV